jgi:type III secretory pathway component EscU
MFRLMILSIVLSVVYCGNALATTTLGGIASNISEPVSLITQLLRAISIICGVGLMMGGIIKYLEYRRNPIAIRLSTVFFMFFFGIALIIVGFIPMAKLP